jgi:CRISPR-associated protein Cas2
MRVVIAFDISDNKKRYRVVKVLKEYATRVQKSVFEATDLNRAGYLRLRSRAERIIDPGTDSLRYYTLCASCMGRIDHYGAGPSLLDEADAVVIS